MKQLLVIGFSKAIRGKGLSKNRPILVKTPLHRRSKEVRRSGLWAPGMAKFGGWSPQGNETKITEPGL